MPSRIFEAETYRFQVLGGGTTITRTIRIGGVDPADDDNATADHACGTSALQSYELIHREQAGRLCRRISRLRPTIGG